VTSLDTFFHVVSLAALSTFVVFLFGRPNSLVHSWPRWRSLALKAALVLTVFGHGLAAIHEFVGELLLHGGLAVLWVWAAIFHYQHFVASGAFTKK
jgi:hypothetical protein